MRRWHAARNVETLCIEPGSPWENGYVESFNGQLRDELLDREIFYNVNGARKATAVTTVVLQHGRAPCNLTSYRCVDSGA